MPELADDYLDFRTTTDGAVRAAQALPPEIYLQAPAVEQGGAVPSAPALPEVPATTEIPTAPPSATPTAPTALTPSTPTPPMPTGSVAPTGVQGQVSEAVAGLTKQILPAPVPRLEPDLGLSKNALQALVAYLPEGHATPLLKQAAQGLDLLLNLTMIPAYGFGVENARKADEVLGPILQRAGVNPKAVGDAVQVVTEFGYGLFQNPVGVITPASVGQTIASAKAIAAASVKVTQMLRTAPEALLGTVKGVVQRIPKTVPELVAVAPDRVVTTAEGVTSVTAPSVDEAVKLADAMHVQPEDAVLAVAAGERMFGTLPQADQLTLQSPAMVGRLLLGAIIGGYTGETKDEQVRNALIGMGLALSPEAIRLLRKWLTREIRTLNKARPVTTPTEVPKVLGITLGAPVPPGTAAAGTNAAGHATILHFDFERMAGDPNALWAAVDDLLTHRGQSATAPNYGELTRERLEAIADVLGIRPDELSKGTGKVLNAQALDAAADVGVAAITELMERNALLQAGIDLNVPAEKLAALVERRDQQLVWTAKIVTNLFEVAGETGAALKKWQDLLPVMREPMGKIRDFAELVQRGLVGSDLVTATLTQMTDVPAQAAPLLRRLWNGGWEIAGAAFQSSLLTGFAAANFMGNAVMTASHLGTTVFAAAGSTLKGAKPGERVYWTMFPAGVIGASVGFARGLGAAIKLADANLPTGTLRAGMRAIREGGSLLDTMAEQARTVTPSKWGTSKVTFTKNRAIASEDLGWSGVAGLAADVMGQVLHVGHTVTNASDEIFKFTNSEMVRYQEAIRYALDKGLRSPDMVRLFVRDFLANTPKIVDRLAEQTSNLLTLTSDLPDYLAQARKAMAHPAYRFIAPFWASPMNAQRFNFAHWPALGRIVEYQQQALAAGGTAAQFAKARMSMGAALIGTTAALVWNGEQGIPVPGTDVRVRFRGRGFSDPGLAQLEKQEVILYSLGIQTEPDGKWQEFGVSRLDFPAMTMGLVADALTIFTHLHDDELWEEVVTAIGVSTWNNVVDRATLRGFADFFSTFTANHPETFAKRTKKYAQHLVGGMVPTALADIERQMSPAVKEVYGFMDQIWSRVPYMSDRLDTKEDVLGDPIMRPLGYPPYLSIFSPIPAREVPGDVVRVELLKNEVNILPPPPYLFGSNPDRTGVPDEKEAVRLTTGPGSQYRRLKDLMTKGKIPAGALAQEAEIPLTGGKMNLKEALAAVIKTHEYRKVLSAGPNGGQQRVLRILINAFRKAAEGQLLAEDQTLQQELIKKSRARGAALVQPEYLQQRYQMTGPQSDSVIRGLTR